jgi:hypothetical protein
MDKEKIKYKKTISTQILMVFFCVVKCFADYNFETSMVIFTNFKIKFRKHLDFSSFS